jgi:hypothetical protein
MIKRGIKRAEDLFCSTIEIKSTAEREAFLRRECEGDPELRAAVDKLPALQPQAEKFFEEFETAKAVRQPQ